MIRFLLIVLMFALPAQFVWAAAAGYCAHESDPVSFHVGHHVHEHRASPDDADRTEAAKSPVTQAHTDCSYCHAVVAQFASPQPSTTGPPPPHIFESSDTNFLGTGAEDSIERPKWTRAS
ncbi:hypothetical protein [Variovorax sp. RHLX14]|uniref:hypothetical protein n=1 Tax=Variovorax sp. RHLX14 TaxID=1259731 RepID=UPI003F493778